MLSLPQIKAQYPAALQPFSRFILREYLQHKLLQLIYDSPLGDRFFWVVPACASSTATAAFRKTLTSITPVLPPPSSVSWPPLSSAAWSWKATKST